MARNGLGHESTLLEIPPTTLRLSGVNVPVGGGGYFRLLPLLVMEWAFAQVRRRCRPPVAMLYFHPWEFDPDQPRWRWAAPADSGPMWAHAPAASVCGPCSAGTAMHGRTDVARRIARRRLASENWAEKVRMFVHWAIERR